MLVVAAVVVATAVVAVAATAKIVALAVEERTPIQEVKYCS